jgi:hypothetical protein
MAEIQKQQKCEGIIGNSLQSTPRQIKLSRFIGQFRVDEILCNFPR